MTPSEERQTSTRRRIALVVAAARNRVIGRDGRMPWKIPSDLKTFRRLTMGRPVIMGRKTFQSIGRALDGRTNIVVTRDPDFVAADVIVARALNEALALAEAAPCRDDIIMVIGGGEVYRAALAHADIVYMTEVAADPVGDTWFPALDPVEWTEAAREEIPPDPRDGHAAELVTYQRRPASGC
ncbi:MAG: dihydrofolate reductase [Hyphomicrobiaceae bacterium]